MITNPECKITVRIPDDVYNFFFRKVFAGDHGIKQTLVHLLITKLYAECRKRNIPAEWDPANANAVRELIANMSFGPEPTGSRTPRRSTRSRRTANSSSVDSSKPTAGADD